MVNTQQGVEVQATKRPSLLFANDHHRDCSAVLTLEHLTVYVCWVILFRSIARDRKTLKMSLPRSMKPSVGRP